MNTTKNLSKKWLSIVSDASAKAGGPTDDWFERLKEVLGGDVMGIALATGISELVEYASRDWAPDDTAVEAEQAAVEASRRAARPLLEAKLQARIDELDKASRGECTCDECGRSARSQGRRPRRWASMLGPLGILRRYVHCKECKKGMAPAQSQLGLTESDFTPGFEEVSTMLATTVPFGMATTLVGKLCRVEVSVKAVQDMTERRGKSVLALQASESQTYRPFDDSGLPVPTPLRPLDAVAEAATPEIAYIEIDGVIPITREELTGHELTDIERQRQKRAKTDKVRGGKGKRFRIVGREVKNAVLYDGKDCANETVGRGCILAKTYVSFLGGWTGFAVRLWVAMLRLRFDEAKLLVVLSDGADWIRSLARWLPIETLLILDLFHVKHRIWEVAHSLHGHHSKKASSWARKHCQAIEDGDAKKVIAALRRISSERTETQELVQALAGYLKNNLDRMNYPDYRARGLRISTAAVESANFHVTGNRLKLQGMRWSKDGAAQMTTLRADLFNGNHESRTRQLLAA